MTHMSFMSCPSLLLSFARHVPVRGFIPHGASAAPDYGMVCSHSSMVVSGQGPTMYSENFYGQGVCTHCLSGAHCTEAGSKRYINIIGQRNGVAARLCDLALGTYFPAE